jgi:biphenyl-2,3-diol 1,2-dioxygenase
MIAPELAHLSHVALVTPDLEASHGFFTTVLGLDVTETGADGTVYLRAWGEFEHHSLSLREGPAGIDHFGWRTRRPENVEAFAKRLAAAGTTVEHVLAGTEAGQGDAIRFITPTGHPFELFFDVEKPEAPAELRSRLKSNPARARRCGISPRRLDHVNITDTDVAGGMAWFGEQLGFQLREYITAGHRGMVSAWASVTSQVHDLALTSDLGGGHGRLHHLAYELGSREELLLGADLLREQRVPIELGPGMHGVAQSMFCYLRDPGSRHRVELYAGSYHVHDPDWAPIEWTRDEIEEALVWWGPEYRPGTGHAFDETSPCLIPHANAATR